MVGSVKNKLNTFDNWRACHEKSAENLNWFYVINAVKMERFILFQQVVIPYNLYDLKPVWLWGSFSGEDF